MDGRVGVLATAHGGNALAALRRVLGHAGCDIVMSPSFDEDRPQVAKPEREIRQLLTETDVVIMAGSQNVIGERTLPDASQRLRGIVTSSLGYNAVDVDACTARGILVANSPVETNYEGVFQHTVMLILAAVRQLPQTQAVTRLGGGWPMSGLGDSDVRAPELRSPFNIGTTLGVIGLGRIGYRVARLFRTQFDTNVLAYDPYVSEERAREIGVALVEDLGELLRSSDVVTIHCFLSDETRHLIGAAELAAMKSTAYLVNTARGTIVDEAALVAALQEKTIAGAALDVTEIEPLPLESPLLQMDNVIVTPHLAGTSTAHSVRSTEFAAMNALRLLAGQAPEGLVNPSALPAWAARFGLTGIRHGGIVRTRIP